MRSAVTWASVVLVALPWLNPFSPGPTPAVIPLLFAWICGACFVCVAVHRSESERDSSLSSWVASAWLLAALLSAFFGMLQYFGAAHVFTPWVNHTEMGAAFGNLRQRNQFATLTNIGLAALAYWATHLCAFEKASKGDVSYTRSEPFVEPVWLVLAGGVLLAAGNAASSSRTGLLQLLVLIGISLAWAKAGASRGGMRKGPWKLYGVALVAYGASVVVLPTLASLDPSATGMLARWRDIGPDCGGRLTLWSNVLHLIAQKPWFGWGWGELDYAHFITLYPGSRFCDILDNAHNLPLHLAVELGVPMALVFCAACLWLVLRARPWRETHSARQLAWTVLAVIGVHSLLEYPLWYGPFQVAAACCIWMMCHSVGAGFSAVNGSRLFRSTVRAVTSTVLVAVTASCLYALWDYWRISQLYMATPERAHAYRDNTLDKVRSSMLFQDQVQFAELTTTPLTAANAAQLHAMAKQLLHFSPEPRVVEKLIESAVMLGRDDEAVFYLQRFQAAFPQEHAAWAKQSARDEAP